VIVRSYDEIAPVEWGNGTSHRLLTESDGMGFTVCETLVRRGTTSALQYRRHLEACYCIGGSGEVVTADGEHHKIMEGTLYALDKHDAHYLVASDDEDLRLISVFNPPLNGDEKHNLSEDGFSQY
jgi:L-ectoine synthase